MSTRRLRRFWEGNYQRLDTLLEEMKAQDQNGEQG
jgi:hypothetical protein